MKRIIVDTNILIRLMKKNDRSLNPLNADIQHKEDDLDLRAEALLASIERSGGTVVIPTPVLAEYLLGIDGERNKQEHVSLISSMSCFEILPFDEIAAIECSMLPSLQEFKQLAKQINSNQTANKIRFDRQILSIAVANGIKEIWSFDGEVITKGRELGIDVKSLLDIAPISLPSQYPFLDWHVEDTAIDKSKMN